MHRLRRMNTCDRISEAMADWRDDLPWFTGYFVVGAWIAILLAFWYQHAV